MHIKYRRFGEFVLKNLNRYISPEAGIARTIDLAHATDAKSSLKQAPKPVKEKESPRHKRRVFRTGRK
jgi:hypothetical protein